MALTKSAIDEAKAADRQWFLWDDELERFGVEINPSGVKSYVVWKASEAQKTMLTLGTTSEVSLAVARFRAQVELIELREVEVDGSTRREDPLLAPDVAEGAQRFLDECHPNRSERDLVKDIAALLGQLKVAEVSSRDVERMLWSVTAECRLGAFDLTCRVFARFESWGWRETGSNPCHRCDRGQYIVRKRHEDDRKIRWEQAMMYRLSIRP